MFSLKTWIVGTLEPDRRVHTLKVFDQKYEKYVYPCVPQFYFIKLELKELYISWICFLDEC